MQISLNIKNESVLEKLLWLLEHFKSDGVEVIQESQANPTKKIEYSDEYIQKNWRDIVSNALSSYDEDYYKSEQYKIDRAKYLMEQYK